MAASPFYREARNFHLPRASPEAAAMHPAQLPVEQLLEECQVQRTRRSGPGGQHRNKVETAIVVEHQSSGLRGEASERRSQEQNRRQAVHRLRVKLALALRQPPADVPSTLWQQRLAGRRFAVNPQHEDFPALLAEALDVVHARETKIADAANHLGLTSSQLTKLLKVNCDALALVNRERLGLGLPRLR